MADPERNPEFDLRRRPFDPQDIASYCGSLVTTETSTKEIRLAHYSVQEFLVSNRLTSRCEIYKIIEQPASISIVKTCLVPLIGASESRLQVISKELPLAKYAAEHWMKHAKAADGTDIDDMDHRISRFLECERARSNWIQLFDPGDLDRRDRFYKVHVVYQPLYYASLAGLHGLVKVLLDNGADVNPQGRGYRNALQAASSGGHEVVVRLLLEHGADANVQGGLYKNALYAASSEW